ncbi:MAG TPA: ATP-binding protein [Verrucomicrobiota bacterium]|nr:ATP-binding protein [Verrucomicrobiota bacterium]HNU52692.1 ATP-binding protein [Verrucomicrobiota bacterium]
MLTTEQLKALMTDLESDRAERTISTKSTDKLGEAVCAFANDFPNNRQPGYLLVGVDNGGKPSGLKVTDELLLDLGALRSNVNIEPLPAIVVEKHTLPDGDVAVVEVLPSDLPPVRYKGRVWIRIGPSRRGANQQEERILTEKRTALQKTFDARPCRGCSLDDLVLDLFLVSYLPAAVAREVIAENRRSPKEQMASLRFYDVVADCPSNAGALLFAKEPLRWIPGAYIQFVRWAGTTMSDDPVDEKRFSGDLITVLRELQAFLSLPTQSYPVPASALRERTETDYPPVAIRELLWNAVMHRSYESNAPVRFYWYDDRIEIQNPGGLYGMASPENFPRQTDYRNPVISGAMATLGYVNAFGRGVIRAQEVLRRNGSPPAEFTFETSHVLATIRKKP